MAKQPLEIPGGGGAVSAPPGHLLPYQTKWEMSHRFGLVPTVSQSSPPPQSLPPLKGGSSGARSSPVSGDSSSYQHRGNEFNLLSRLIFPLQ